MGVNAIEIYTRATRIAHSHNQVVGEKSDYYITLAQLEAILQRIKTSVAGKRMAGHGTE